MHFSRISHEHEGHNDLESHTSRCLSEVLSKTGNDPKTFLSFLDGDLLVVEEIAQKNIF